MVFLPGLAEEASQNGWTRSQAISIIATEYLVIATYTFLIVLALRNIYTILVRQKEYKNLPILAFYTYAILAVSLRPINMIWFRTGNPVIANLDFVQQGAKLAVGVVQDWITLELAIRIRNAKGKSDVSEKQTRQLRIGRALLFSFVTLAFVAFNIIIIVRAHQHGGYAFPNNYCLVYSLLGYLFLCQVILMTLLVIWLFVETQRSIERERQARLDGKVTYNLWRERRTYAIISTIFGLSYIGRGFYNVYNSGGDGFGGSVFAAQMVEFTIYLFEGASMGVLMVFHCINFSNGRLFTQKEVEEPSYASVMPGEYHRFDTEEVDAESVSDRSKSEIEELERARIDQASFDDDN